MDWITPPWHKGFAALARHNDAHTNRKLLKEILNVET
jgi:hypothetical protein